MTDLSQSAGPRPRLVRALLPIPLLALISCQYVGDRTLDFLDPYRVTVGAGTTIGVRGKYVGLVDTGIMVGVKPKVGALGWRYGTPLWFNQNDGRIDADQAEIIKTTSVVDLDIGTGDYRSAQNSAALLPAIFTWADSSPTDYEWQVPEQGQDFVERYWIWSEESFHRNRYAQIHAFDIEMEVALGVYIGAGFSPGEAVDFFLGLLTIDIARDDGRL